MFCSCASVLWPRRRAPVARVHLLTCTLAAGGNMSKRRDMGLTGLAGLLARLSLNLRSVNTGV
eukprot:5464502-Heterocapsa_arctica.AAC.1